MRVELYTTKDGARCKAVREALEGLKAAHGFELVETDVALAEGLAAERSRVPVVRVDGREIAAGEIDLGALKEAILRKVHAAGVSRRGKVAFAIFAAVSLLAILGSKVWQIFVEPDQLSRQYLGIEVVDGPAPEFVLEAHDGESVKLSDYRGKLVFLNYWATWCDACLQEMPAMSMLAKRLEGAPMVMVAATVDDGWAPVDKYFAGQAPPFVVLRDAESKWAHTYGTKLFPETYLIGADGRLMAKFVGPRDWSDKSFELYFRKLLAELAPKS